MRLRKAMKAFVLVKVATGRENEAMKALHAIPTLEDVHFLFGDYDYIVTINSPDCSALSRLVTHRLRKIPGIERTVTLLEAPG